MIVWILTFLCGAESKDDKNIEWNTQDTIDARAHTIVNELSLQRAHDGIVDSAAQFEQAEAP